MHTDTLTLYELNQLVKEALTLTMPDEYWVEAEISELREVRGHCYMELVQKDPHNHIPLAKASAKCWKNRWAYLGPYFERTAGQTLRAGLKVRAKVYAHFHESYGFSWIINDLDPTFTLGDMARKRREIILQLKAEGVFDLQRELSLPLFAQRIAVVSSEQAAGYGDFYRQLKNNQLGLQFHVSLFPAVMQGEQTESSIVDALNRINSRIEDFDAVVLIRGGGAISDLSSFDSLLLAENVANFPLPVITGIGHDRDESILDMVACIRVKTPTAAATLLVEHLAEVYHRVVKAQEKLSHLVRHRMEMEGMRLERMTEKIPVLFSLVKSRQEERMTQLSLRLQHAVKERIQQEKQYVDRLELQIPSLIHRKITQEEHRITMLTQRSQAQDPAVLLKRGYSITLHRGRVVHDAEVLQPGDVLETRVEKGQITSIVK